MMENEVLHILTIRHTATERTRCCCRNVCCKRGKTQKVSIRSGSKVSPYDTGENRDDFIVKNARLVLSDGTVIKTGAGSG